MRLLVTGGAGFIGSAFVRVVMRDRRGWEVTVLDSLTYAGNLRNLDSVADRIRFIRGDVADPEAVSDLLSDLVPDAVVHFAAESHVDRSLLDAAPFIRTNVLGTQVLLDAVRKQHAGRYVHVSTDEVYGDIAGSQRSHPDDALRPRSPYAASKAAADLLVLAAHVTYGQDVVITRGSNTYGPYHFPEKLIPLAITNVLLGEDVPVYGDGKQVREWIHVEDHAHGILAALEKGRSGCIYHLGPGEGLTNLHVLRLIIDLMGADMSRLRFVQDRLGHDRRYAIEVEPSLAELGLALSRTFEDGLAETVQWYREHEDWWRSVRSGEYRTYYDRMVATRPGFRA